MLNSTATGKQQQTGVVNSCTTEPHTTLCNGYLLLEFARHFLLEFFRQFLDRRRLPRCHVALDLLEFVVAISQGFAHRLTLAEHPMQLVHLREVFLKDAHTLVAPIGGAVVTTRWRHRKRDTSRRDGYGDRLDYVLRLASGLKVRN